MKGSALRWMANLGAAPFGIRESSLGGAGWEKREVAHRLRREMTPAEARLWQFLRANRLAGLHFRRQQVIDEFIADFYCHKAGLVIELDGKVHERQREYDEARDQIIRCRGLQILRVTNDRVLLEINSVLRTIHQRASATVPDVPPYEPFPET
jgi:very-short-patch-repair endonuclease